VSEERFDFDTVVLERSRTVPVVVDFWAAWCAPCRMLGPILEDLAATAAGRWELVQIDVDQNADLAAALGVRGIPAVQMFDQGRVVARFVGALPRTEVERWLETNLPDQRLERLDALGREWIVRGRTVLPEIETFAATNPDLPLARLRLAQALATTDPARAREMLRDLPATADAELATDVESIAELAETRDDAPSRSAPQLATARTALAAHDLDRALDSLVDAVAADRRFGDELARRAAVALFRFLGPDHELTRTYQRRLASVLLV